LALVAIAVIVALVSMPRLRELGMRENARDAERISKLLGEALASQSVAGGEPAPALKGLIERDHGLARALADAEWMADGRMRCHGYLYELLTESGQGWVSAWPWSWSRTGREAFLWDTRTGRGFRHENDGGLYSGPGAGPLVPTPGGAPPEAWQPLR
jgi:hypothetical protein